MIAAIAFGLKYLPIIIGAVQLIENMANGTGAQKRAAAINLVEKTLTQFGVQFTPRAREITGQLIDLSVNVLNAFGFFKSTEGSDPELVEIATPEAKAQHVPVNETDDEFERLERLLRGEKE